MHDNKNQQYSNLRDAVGEISHPTCSLLNSPKVKSLHVLNYVVPSSRL
jgi:hypothetical protein